MRYTIMNNPLEFARMSFGVYSETVWPFQKLKPCAPFTQGFLNLCFERNACLRVLQHQPLEGVHFLRRDSRCLPVALRTELWRAASGRKGVQHRHELLEYF